MNPIQNSKQNRLQLLESFIVKQGLSTQFSEFVEAIETQSISGAFDNEPLHPSAKLVDRCLLRVYLETKELIEWFGLSPIVGCLSDLASDHMFSYKGHEQDDLADAAVQSDQLREKTQLVLGLIKYMNNANHHIQSAERFKYEASGHIFAKYPDLTNY